MILGIVSAIVGLLATLSIPDKEIAISAFKKVLIPVNLLYPLSSLFIGFLLMNAVRHINIERALRIGEEKYRRIFETIVEGYILVAMDGTIKSVNPATVNILGYDTSEYLKKINLKDVCVNTEKQNEIKSLLIKQKYLKGYILRFKHKSGKEIIADCNFHLLVNEKGEPDAIEGTFRDITIRKKNEKELETYRENLEEIVKERTKELSVAKSKAEVANEAKSIFLANMSHEIRTPMNAILGFTEVLKELEQEPKKIHYIENIRSSGKSLLTLINDILDLSKIEAGKLEIQKNPTSISKLLEEMKTFFNDKIREKGLEMIIESDSKLPERLLLDNIRLRQILINIIGNAVKFTENGYIRIITNLQNKKNDNRSCIDLTIVIEDTGIGIPADQQKIIFDAFEQTKQKKASKLGGTGLGLAITRRLIEMTDGIISIESEIGKGSSFKLIIPDVEIAAGYKEEISIDILDFSTINFDSAKILIVDDIEYNIELINSFLGSWKFKIVTAENGKEAIELAEELHPDLILLDMKMPVMDGYEAAKILKENSVLKSIPIIAVSASALKQDKEIMNKFCDSFITKPFSKTDLIKQVMKYLPYTEIKNNTHVSDIKNIETIIPLPENDMIKLHELAMMGDMNEIIKYANSLESQNKKYMPFCQKLIDLAGSYMDKEVLKIIEYYLDNKNEK